MGMGMTAWERDGMGTARTTTRSCRTWKRAVHVYSPGVAAARQVRALYCRGPPLLLSLLLLL